MTISTETLSPWFAPMRDMLRLGDYALPLAAAESQFRDRFYGLNAAALLEDIHVDALQSYTRKYSPGVSVERAQRGEKAFDYRVAGVPVSHKVGLGATDIAVLWDATREMQSWSAGHPIAYHLTDAKARPRAVRRADEDAEFADKVHARALHHVIPPERARHAARQVAVVHWPPENVPARVLTVLSVPADAATLADVISFPNLWTVVTTAIHQEGLPANEIDVLLVRSAQQRNMPTLEPGAEVVIDPFLRSGLYGLATEWMQEVPLIRNNRAQLIPNYTVAALLKKAMDNNSFAPLPTWIAPYAATQPTSLYLAQAQAFQQMF